jgi:hypothetical protein
MTTNRIADDSEVGQVLVRGAAIGIPIAFVVATLMALPGAGLSMALMIAVVPGIVAGPWMGSTIVLIHRALVADSHPATVTHLPATRAPAEPTAHRAA